VIVTTSELLTQISTLLKLSKTLLSGDKLDLIDVRLGEKRDDGFNLIAARTASTLQRVIWKITS